MNVPKRVAPQSSVSRRLFGRRDCAWIALPWRFRPWLRSWIRA